MKGHLVASLKHSLKSHTECKSEPGSRQMSGSQEPTSSKKCSQAVWMIQPEKKLITYSKFDHWSNGIGTLVMFLNNLD